MKKIRKWFRKYDREIGLCIIWVLMILVLGRYVDPTHRWDLWAILGVVGLYVIRRVSTVFRNQYPKS